jgi:hypothetical protein
MRQLVQLQRRSNSPRSVRLIAGEKVIADHKTTMTPEVLAISRSMRAQTAKDVR